MQKFLAVTLLTLFTTNVIADVCPTIKDLKSRKAAHWQAFDSDNDKPLSATREARLRKAVAEFAMAEWSTSKSKNAIHCYYNDVHGSAMEAYFAKESTLPAKSSKYWYQVTGMIQCAAGADKCQFQSLPDMTHQLASSES